MRIRANAWYLQVFLQAYVHDRYWLDAETIGPAERPELPETVAYQAFEKKYYEMPHEQRFNEETQKKLHELAEASQKAYAKWHKEQQTIYTANRSREVSERLHAGRMSLCPYFWSVVSALVFYYGFVRSTRPFRQLVYRAAPALATGLFVLMAGGLVSLIGYGIYESRDQIPTPAGVVAGIKNEYREYKESQRREAEYQTQRIREQQEWERANPQEAALRRQQEEQYRQQQERWRARERTSEWRQFKSNLKEFAVGAGVLVGGLIGVVLAIALLCYVVLLLGRVFSFLVRFLRPFVEPLSFKSVPETGFRAWLVRQFRRVARAWAAWRQFWKDTRELVAVFAKAKKERVCPYLTVVNGENQV